MKPGVYFDITNADYHGGEGVSKSLLDVVARSPLHAKALLDRANDNDRVPTPAQVIGTAFHALLLEPEAFANEYVCELTRDDAPHAIGDRETLVAMVEELNKDRLPKLATGGTKEEMVGRILRAYGEQGCGDGLSREELEGRPAKLLKLELEELNQGRAGLLSTSGSMQDLAAILSANGKPVTLWSDVRARWASENEGYTVLSVDDYNQLLDMRDAVMAHPAASALLTGCPGVAEASVYATDPETGELRRVRPDFWRQDGIIVDVKTTIDAGPEGFGKSVASYGYHCQDAYYLDTLQLAHEAGAFATAPKAFVFLAVEKTARVVDGQALGVAVYQLDDESREIGRQQYRANLDKLAECRRTNVWPGYGDAIQRLGVPDWYLRRNLHLVGAA